MSINFTCYALFKVKAQSMKLKSKRLLNLLAPSPGATMTNASARFIATCCNGKENKAWRNKTKTAPHVQQPPPGVQLQVQLFHMGALCRVCQCLPHLPGYK